MNKFLLVRDKFMPEMHLKQPGFIMLLVAHLPKTKKELKSLCRQDTQILFTETTFIKLVFSMISPIANQMI